MRTTLPTTRQPVIVVARRDADMLALGLVILLSIPWWLTALGEWSQALSALAEALAMVAVVYWVQAVILVKIIGWTIGVHHERLARLEL